jgi:hypothetical protein
MLMFRCRCGMAYRDLDMLLRHCKVTHGRVPTGPGSPPGPPPPPPSDAAEQRPEARERAAEERRGQQTR